MGKFVEHTVVLDKKVWKSTKDVLRVFETSDDYYVHLGTLAETLGGVTCDRLYKLVSAMKDVYISKIDGCGARRHFVTVDDLPKVLILIGWPQDRIEQAMDGLEAYVNLAEPCESNSGSEEEPEEKRQDKRVRFPEEEGEDMLAKIHAELVEHKALIQSSFQNGAKEAYIMTDAFKAQIPGWVEQKGKEELASLRTAIEAKIIAEANKKADEMIATARHTAHGILIKARNDADALIDAANKEAASIVGAAREQAIAERQKIAADERERVRKENAARFQQEDNLNFIKETYARLTEGSSSSAKKRAISGNDDLLEKIFQ